MNENKNNCTEQETLEFENCLSEWSYSVFKEQLARYEAECTAQNFFELAPSEHRKLPSAAIVLPERSTAGSVGYDFVLPCDLSILPHDFAFYWSDIRVHMADGYFLALLPRSSAGKYPLYLANTCGVIDSSYYGNADNGGNIGFRFFNPTDVPIYLSEGTRVCQGIFVKADTESGAVSTERTGGFGSTGA